MDSNRTDTARDHDDSAAIDAIEKTPTQGGSSGGGLGRDIGSSDDLGQVEDPDGHTRATKQDDIDNDVAERSSRRPA